MGFLEGLLKRKSQAPALSPAQQMAEVMESFPAYANALALSEAGEAKTFDWAHYQTVTQGAYGAPLFNGEFNIVPTIRVMKGLLLQEPWVNACVMAIARQFLCSKFVLKRQTKDGVETIASHAFLDYLRTAGADVENQAVFYTNTVADLVSTGNAYWYDPLDLKDRRRIPSERIDPVINNNRVSKYRLLDRADLGMKQAVVEFSPEEITHLKLPNPFSPHVGLSMIIATVLPVLIEKYGREYVVGFFLRGGNSAGVIETDTTDVNQLLRFAKTIMQAFGGRKNMHADKILPKGATWKGTSGGFSEIGLIELLKDNLGVFRAATGCTNTVLGIVENVNRATAFAEMELFWLSTVLPLQSLLAACIQSSAVWKRFGLGPDVELGFDNSGVVYLDDFDRRLEQDAKLAKTWTVNERRERLGKEPLERLDDKLEVELIKPQVVLAPGSGADPAAGTDPAAAGTAAGEAEAANNAVTAPTVALNGAQVASLLEIVNQVATGKIPRETGIALIMAAFALSAEQAEEIMGPVGDTFFVEEPEPPPPSNNPPPPPPKGGKEEDEGKPEAEEDKSFSAKAFTNERWKAEEESVQEPTAVLRLLFVHEFKEWRDLVLENLKDRGKAESAIKARAETFARDFTDNATPPAMRAWMNQLNVAIHAAKAAGSIVTKESAQDRRAKLELLKDRAKQVIEDGIFKNGKRTFLGYSETAMNSIYAFIEAEFQAGKSNADVASAVRTRFAESYGLSEAYSGQAETIVRTEFGAAISLGQAQFSADLASVTKRMKKAWVSMGDQHTRESHLEAETIELEGPSADVVDMRWPNGLRYPRDSDGDPAEVINCRCTIRHIPVEWKD